MLNLRPWYKDPSAKTIAPASAAATKAITARALEKAQPNRGAVEAAE
jgi:hypothetical protein